MFDSRKPNRFLPIFVVSLFCLCHLTFAGVSQKKFDFRKGDVVKTEPVKDSIESKVQAVKASDIKTTSSYFFIGSDAMWEWLVSSQKTLREKISAQAYNLKSGQTKSVWLFFLVCFIYGMIHAIGPGHGKTIVASYFIARKGKILQGVGLGTSITVIHTLSAVVLLFALYGIAKATLFPIFEASRINIEKASYALIILTGILLVAISIRETIKGRSEDESVQDASWKELLWLAFITGIVPCPAVALVVFFCLLNDLPGLAICGAAFIGIGMAVTNTAFGIGAIAIRRGIDRSISRIGNLKRWASYINTGISLLCGVCISMLGVFLILNVR